MTRQHPLPSNQAQEWKTFSIRDERDLSSPASQPPADTMPRPVSPKSAPARSARSARRTGNDGAAALPASHSAAVDALLERISTEFAGLSRQLKLIARYVEQHRDHLGLDKIQEAFEVARKGVSAKKVIVSL